MSQVVQAKDLAFPAEEFQRRLKGIHAGMAERGLDALIVFGPENIFYVTGFETIGYSAFQLAVITPGGEPRLLVRELERGAARRMSWAPGEPSSIQDGQDPIAAVIELLEGLGLGSARVGIDRSSGFLSINHYLALLDRLPTLQAVDGSGVGEAVRRIKSPLEID